MEPKVLSKQQKQDYFVGVLSMAGIRFDQPEIAELIVDLYDKILETGGSVTLDEVMEMKNSWVQKTNAMKVVKPDKEKESK